MKKALKIIIVEDHKAFANALLFYLEKKLGHEVLFVAHSAEEFLHNNAKYLADLIFMDIELPDGNGINITKKVLHESSNLRFVAMTMYDEKVYLEQMIKAGFKGALLKTNFYENLNEAIERVMNNRMYFPKNINVFKK